MSFTVRPVREDKKPKRKWWRSLPVLITIGESLVRLYGAFKKRHEQEAANANRMRLLKRVATILISVLLVMLVAVGTLRILVGIKAISLGGMLSMAGAELPKDDHGFTNILLLGTGDEDHDGIDLTDTIMVASLDPDNTGGAVLLSLPRDIEVLNTHEMGKGRINSLYRDYKNLLVRKGTEKNEASTEALKQLGAEIGELIGLPIHGVIKLNFSGFEEAVDAIGGVDVVVPEDLTDTEYPGPNYSYETFSITAGAQHLDGATALKYARSRHSTSDFSRSARQQQIISAIAEKTKADGTIKNVSKLTELFSIVAKNMQTTFGTRELIGLAAMGKHIDQTKVISMQLNDQNGLYSSYVERGGFLYAPPREQFDGASVLLPVSIPEYPVTWKQIQTLSSLLFVKRELFISPPSIVILNAGAKEGAARVLGGELARYGFNVQKTRNFSKPNQSFDVSSILGNTMVATGPDDTEGKKRIKKADESIKALSSMLHIEQKTLQSNLAAADEAQPDIFIVLGKDYHYQSLQELLTK